MKNNHFKKKMFDDDQFHATNTQGYFTALQMQGGEKAKVSFRIS